jgi:hypothetical protein
MRGQYVMLVLVAGYPGKFDTRSEQPATVSSETAGLCDVRERDPRMSGSLPKEELILLPPNGATRPFVPKRV